MLSFHLPFAWTRRFGCSPHRNQVGGTGLGKYLEFGLCPLTSVKPRAVNWVSDPSLRNPEGRGRLAALGWKRREWPIPPELAGWDVRVFSMDHIRNAWKRGPVSWQESDHKGKNQFDSFPSPEDMIISSKVASVLSPYLFSFSVTHHHHLFSVLGWRKKLMGGGEQEVSWTECIQTDKLLPHSLFHCRPLVISRCKLGLRSHLKLSPTLEFGCNCISCLCDLILRLMTNSEPWSLYYLRLIRIVGSGPHFHLGHKKCNKI